MEATNAAHLLFVVDQFEPLGAACKAKHPTMCCLIESLDLRGLTTLVSNMVRLEIYRDLLLSARAVRCFFKLDLSLCEHNSYLKLDS